MNPTPPTDLSRRLAEVEEYRKANPGGIPDIVSQLAAIVAQQEGERCEHCGSDRIYTGPPDCPHCGAPICCQTCCKITRLEGEVAAAQAQFSIMLNSQGCTAKRAEDLEKLLEQTQTELNSANKAATEATEANGRHYAALQLTEERIANLEAELARERIMHKSTSASLRGVEEYRNILIRNLDDLRAQLSAAQQRVEELEGQLSNRITS